MTSRVNEYTDGVLARITQIAAMAADGGLDPAIDLLTEAIEAGAVLQAFGTGHSEAFAMEIAGRAGGLIPTNKIALRDVVLRGNRDAGALGGSTLERDPSIADELWAVSPIHPGDVFLIASNSGVNGSIVGLALLAKEHGHPVIAVTSLAHTMAVTPKHASGLRLSEVADVVIDNLAPYGDATIALRQAQGTDGEAQGTDGEAQGTDGEAQGTDGEAQGTDASNASNGSAGGVPVGAVSSITAAFIAQLLTLGVADRIAATGQVPPLYLSANIPGGDAHNSALEAMYPGRITRGI